MKTAKTNQSISARKAKQLNKTAREVGKTLRLQREVANTYQKRATMPIPTLGHIKKCVSEIGNDFFSRANTKFFKTRKVSKRAFVITCHNESGKALYFFSHYSDLLYISPVPTSDTSEQIGLTHIMYKGHVYALRINLETGHFLSVA